MRSPPLGLRAGMLALAGIAALVPAVAAQAPDRDRIARMLVEQSAHVQEGDVVLITGTVHDQELLEDLAVHVRRQGAFPMLMVGSDRLSSRLLREVPARFDSQAPKDDLALMEFVDLTISVDGPGGDSLAAILPPERVAARAKAFRPVNELVERRAVRSVNLGNELYPSRTLARITGMGEADLARLFWAGVAVEPARLAATAQGIRQTLAAGHEVRVTHPNGTDLRFRIENRPVFVSDGEISTEDRARGAAGVQVWLPAGEVYLAPVAGTARGRLVVPHDRFRGRDITGLALTFEGGRLTAMTADSGLEAIKTVYDAMGPGKEELGVLDIGVNPAITVPAGGRLHPWMAAGMVSLGIGNNTWVGGENRSEFGKAFHLPGATVLVDGRPIVRDGKLQTRVATR